MRDLLIFILGCILGFIFQNKMNRWIVTAYATLVKSLYDRFKLQRKFIRACIINRHLKILLGWKVKRVKKITQEEAFSIIKKALIDEIEKTTEN